jgi:hypothetical protein
VWHALACGDAEKANAGDSLKIKIFRSAPVERSGVFTLFSEAGVLPRAGRRRRPHLKQT